MEGDGEAAGNGKREQPTRRTESSGLTNGVVAEGRRETKHFDLQTLGHPEGTSQPPLDQLPPPTARSWKNVVSGSHMGLKDIGIFKEEDTHNLGVATGSKAIINQKVVNREKLGETL